MVPSKWTPDVSSRTVETPGKSTNRDKAELKGVVSSKGFVLRLYLGSSLQGLCFSSLVFTLLKQSGGSLCYQQRSFFIIIILSTILRGTSTLAEIWVTYCASLPRPVVQNQ